MLLFTESALITIKVVSYFFLYLLFIVNIFTFIFDIVLSSLFPYTFFFTENCLPQNYPSVLAPLYNKDAKVKNIYHKTKF